jgi:hypothetical protein
MNRDRGAILIIIMILTLMGAGLSGAILGMSFSHHRTSREVLFREQAFQASESGASFYLSKLAGDNNYFNSNPAPHAPIRLGSTSFRLESAELVAGSTSQWQVRLLGACDQVTYPLDTVIGHRRIPIPDGIVATGTGNVNSVVLRIENGTRVGSFDPDIAAYDPANPGQDANVAGKGGMTVTSSNVYGDITVTGNSTETASWVGGTITENAPDFPVDDIDPIVFNAMNESQTTNQNAALAGIFGSQWQPVVSGQNYGNLIVSTAGTYVIPSGTYRFRRFEVRNGARVVFDTSAGPSRLVYVGSGQGTGTGNDLTVTGTNSSVKVNSGGTNNGLLTVLGPDCDFVVTSNGVFGQSTNDPTNAGYTQIISLGGNTSSDDIKVTTGGTVYGRLYAAAHLLTVDSASWYGSALARTATLRNATFAVDVGSLGKSLIDPSAYEILARWPVGG